MYYGTSCCRPLMTYGASVSGVTDYGGERGICRASVPAASTADEKGRRKKCAISPNAPIIPVLYRELNVHTNKNFVSGMN